MVVSPVNVTKYLPAVLMRFGAKHNGTVIFMHEKFRNSIDFSTRAFTFSYIILDRSFCCPSLITLSKSWTSLLTFGDMIIQFKRAYITVRQVFATQNGCACWLKSFASNTINAQHEKIASGKWTKISKNVDLNGCVNPNDAKGSRSDCKIFIAEADWF